MPLDLLLRKRKSVSGPWLCHPSVAPGAVPPPAGPASWQSQSRPWCLASRSVNFEYQETPQVVAFLPSGMGIMWNAYNR